MRRQHEEDKGFSFGACEAYLETEKAIGVRRLEGSTEDPLEKDPFWVPKSVIHNDSDVKAKDDEGELVVKTWWAVNNSHA